MVSCVLYIHTVTVLPLAVHILPSQCDLLQVHTLAGHSFVYIAVCTAQLYNYVVYICTVHLLQVHTLDTAVPDGMLCTVCVLNFLYTAKCQFYTLLQQMVCCVQSVSLTSYIQPSVSSTHSSSRWYVVYSVGPSDPLATLSISRHTLLHQVVCCVLIRCTVSPQRAWCAADCISCAYVAGV